jgi:putative hemolysin
LAGKEATAPDEALAAGPLDEDLPYHASALALIVLAVAPGCGSSEPGEIGEAPSALANPASVYCANLGYSLESHRTTSGDEYLVRLFPDGSSCEEWNFYRGICGHRFSYCNTHGGQIMHRSENHAGASYSYGVCVFPDRSECGEGDYSTGSCRTSQCRRWSIGTGCVRIQ